jgi:hypothetical protein
VFRNACEYYITVVTTHPSSVSQDYKLSRGWGCGSVVEPLPGTKEALGLIDSMAIKYNNNNF